MARMKPYRQHGLCVVLLMMLASTLGAADAQETANPGDGVMGFLRRAEEMIERRTSWFYRHFGKKIVEGRIQSASACDFNNPNSIPFCAPTHHSLLVQSVG